MNAGLGSVPAAALTRQLKYLFVEVWWGEAPDRSVSGCGELGPVELPDPVRPMDRRAAGLRFAATLGGDSTNGDVHWSNGALVRSRTANRGSARVAARQNLGGKRINGFANIVEPEGASPRQRLRLTRMDSRRHRG